MFNKWHRARIKRLEEIVADLKQWHDHPIIGEYAYLENYHGEVWVDWTKFRQCDITDNVNGHVKIFNHWFKKKNIVYYNDQYAKQKNSIAKKLKEI